MFGYTLDEFMLLCNNTPLVSAVAVCLQAHQSTVIDL
jgi:hypothetical protein